MPTVSDMKEKTSKNNSVSPVCSRCGYPAKGISELICPECGADLRVIGTVMPGKRGRIVYGCMIPTLFTLLAVVLSLGLYIYLGRYALPLYNDYNITLQFEPESGEFREAMFWLSATSITKPGQTTPQESIDALTNHSTTPSTTSLSIFNSKTQLDYYAVMLTLSPDRSSPTAKYDWMINIDPATGEAYWTDAKTNVKQYSNGPISDKDILACLASLDADITNPDVISEAKELQNFIDGLLNGQTQFTLRGFNAWSYGHGKIISPGPIWFLISYWIVWGSIWLIGLFLIIRKAKKRAFG